MKRKEEISSGKYCLETATACLLVIDVQEKFQSAISAFDSVADRCATLVKGFAALSLPVLVSEQYPKGLGQTAVSIRESCPQWNPIQKITFSCARTAEFVDRLESLDRNSIVVCGIESHVCVNQTVCDLLVSGYSVHIVTDAIASRKNSDYQTAIEKMKTAGAFLTTTEMCLFELLATAEAPQFKLIQSLIR